MKRNPTDRAYSLQSKSNNMEKVHMISKPFCFDLGKMSDNYKHKVDVEILFISMRANMFKRSLFFLEWVFF